MLDTYIFSFLATLNKLFVFMKNIKYLYNNSTYVDVVKNNF